MLNGSNGWLALGNEAVAYGTPAAALVQQHGISCGIGPEQLRVPPPILGSNAPHTGQILGSSVRGGIELAMSRTRAVLSVLYGHFASLTTNDYNFLGTPTVDSLTAFANYGSATLEYQYTGLVGNTISWDLRGDGRHSTISADFIGRGTVIHTTDRGAITVPSESLLVLPVGLGTLSVDYGTPTAVESLKSAQVSLSRSVTDMGRQRMGSDDLAQPLIGGDRPVISATLNLEFDNESGNDTAALLARWIGEQLVGTVTFGDFELSGCRPVGDMPALGRGWIEYALRLEATGLEVTTVA